MKQEEFFEQVKALFEETGNITAGGIRMLNLESLQKEAGDQWDLIKDRVDQTARAVLDRYLGPKDAYLHTANGVYIVIFGEYSGDAARLRMVEIAQDLRARLLHDASVPKFNLKVLGEAAELGGDSSKSALAAFGDFINEHRRLELQSGGEDPFFASSNADLAFSPLWNSQTNASITSYLEAKPDSLPFKLRRLRGRAEHAADRRAQAVIDCTVLACAVESLRQRDPEERGSILCPVICATSFSTESLLNLILPYLRRVPEETRPFFVPLLKEDRLGSQAADLRGKPAMLQPFTREQGVLTQLDDPGLSLIRDEGFTVVGVDVRDYRTMNARRFLEELTQFAEQARKLNLQAIAIGVEDAGMGRMCMESDILIIGGEYATGCYQTPPPPRQMPREELENKFMLERDVA